MLAFVGVTGVRTTFSCQTANIVLYLFLCEPRNPIPKLRLPPPLAGAGHRGYEEPRGAKRSGVKSGSSVSSIAALRCRRSRPARVLRSSGCAMSFARSSLSVCRSRQPNSSPFRSAVSTKRCSCLSARCTPPQRVRTSRPSIVSSRSSASSTAITDSPLPRGRARKLRRTGSRRLSSVRSRSKAQARVTR